VLDRKTRPCSLDPCSLFEIPLNRVHTDRGTEYYAAPDRHEYELYLAVENIDHTRTKTRHPQTNGICERFHKTVLNEFYRVAFRKKIYRTLKELQTDLDGWIEEYNEQRPHTRAVVLWQDPDADVLGQCVVGEGENLSGLIPVRTRCLSDEVLT
jgi:transposase InsO family protein